MSVETDLRRGSVLAGYRIEALVGRGGMGVVYLASDPRLERRVALKLIAPELAEDPRFRERFLRESRLVASLDHSHVVPVYEAGEADGQLYLAMRYVDGEDLASLLAREGPLEPGRALDLVGQVGEALDAAHERGLVHRDVKPANVLVTTEGGREHCYLTDFGLARDQDAASDAQTHLSGTVDYTAPEQIASEPAEARADVYSLGCVLFESLAGEPPFKRPRPLATLFAHRSEEPPSLHELRPELPAAIDGVIAKALAKEPEERYATCRELTDAARAALGLEPQPRLSRRRLLVIAAAAAAVVAAAAAIPAILLGGGEPGPKVALPVTENTLLRIDPRTGEPIAAVPLGEDPTHLAAGDGSVWVVDSREHRLLRTDPQQDAVVDSVDISSIGPSELYTGDRHLLAGAGAVWLTGVETDVSRVWKYDVSSGELSPFTRAFLLALVEAGEDGVWVSGLSNGVVRLDAATGRALETTPGDVSSSWSAIGEKAIWHSPYDDVGVIAALDRKTGKVVASVATGLTTVDEIRIGEGAVWVLGDGESLVRIDPEAGRVDQTISVGRSADSMVVGDGFVWVGSSRDGTVTRVDPETSDLKAVDVGGRPRAIAVAEGGVWVIVRPA